MSDLVALVPVFINGLGARELVFALYLPQVGVADETAVALAFLVFLVRLVVSLLGAGVILARRPRVDAAVAPTARRD
jgi:hypothetical protein